MQCLSGFFVCLLSSCIYACLYFACIILLCFDFPSTFTSLFFAPTSSALLPVLPCVFFYCTHVCLCREFHYMIVLVTSLWFARARGVLVLVVCSWFTRARGAFIFVVCSCSWRAHDCGLLVCSWCVCARGMLVVCSCEWCTRARSWCNRALVVCSCSCSWFARAHAMFVVCSWFARARGLLVLVLFSWCVLLCCCRVVVCACGHGRDVVSVVVPYSCPQTPTPQPENQPAQGPKPPSNPST